MTDFAPVLAFSLLQEGGFVNDPQDTGGATNWGITRMGLADWRGRPVTVDDVRALGRTEAAEIYRVEYWLPMHGPDLPAGLDLDVFDFGINAGPGTSIRLLQRVVGAVPDGSIGPATLKAAQCSLAVLRHRIQALGSLQLAYYHSMRPAQFARFGKGWVARTERRQAAAMALTIHAAPGAAAAPTAELG